MSNTNSKFKDISLLITHYNRPASLQRLLDNFISINCTFGEIVVSDDGSNTENLKEVNSLKENYNFVLITTPKNKGLGNNINKGQAAVKTPYTLYVQEDFVAGDLFPSKLEQSLNLIKEDLSVDIVRYYAYHKYPNLKPYKDGFSWMIFDVANIFSSYKKFYLYSDHPHLRRSNFLDKFGQYPEGVNVEKSEYGMMMSFLKLKGKALFYDSFQDLFTQINSVDEPSTFKRNWRRNEKNILIKIASHLYRHIKFNLNYHLK